MVAQLTKSPEHQQLLIAQLKTLPSEWALTPVRGNKACYRTNWQFEVPLSHQDLIAEIKSGKAKGYGIRTGTVSGGIVAVDADGCAAHDKINELSSGVPLPETVAFTSNKPGRCQYLFYVPQEYWEAIATKKISTGVKGDDGKEQKLELRWDGCQSVLPPSVHPETGVYRWRKSPSEIAIAPAPMWVIEAMLAEPESTQHEPERHATSYTRKARTGEEWSNEEWALSYLSALSSYRADDYETWLAVGMALHSVDDSFLTEWDNWSRQSSKYKPGDCEKKWKSFKRQGVAIGSLAHMAKQDGWRSPFQRSDESTCPSNIGFSNRDYSGTKSAQKLPLKEAVVKAREILTAESDELTANIKLEEIREACGMSGYDWERKIIKPLKRDLEGDRFKLELLGLLQIDDQVERIRQQALLAPKYQMSSSLIEKAMSAMKQRTQTPEAKALDLDELFDLESEGLSWVIPGLLPEGETIVLAGAPKAGKTLLAIDAAYSVVTGESYFLGEAVKRGKVLLISTDESANSTKAKLINRGFRRGDKDSIKVLPTWDISQMGALEALLEDFRPNLVIIDSLRRINKGSEISENSAEFADAIYTLKETLERYGASGILIHHTNKDREALGVHRLRGSSAIAGAVWGTWQLDQIPKSDPNNKKKFIIDPKDPTRTLSVFARDIEGQQLMVELNPENSSWVKRSEVGDSVEAAAERDTLQARILRLLGIPAHALGLSGSEIIECLDDADVEKRSVYNCLNRMVTKRLIACKPAPGDKRYNIYSLPNCHTPKQSSANCHTQEISLPPPSPPPTEPDDDYYAESITTYGIEDSHQNSHHPNKISHHQTVGNPTDDYSNADLPSDSEIVITCPALGEGGGGENSNPVTVDRVTVVEKAIAPSPATTPDAPALAYTVGEKATELSSSDAVRTPKAGDRIHHPEFGVGTLEQLIDNMAFCIFDELWDSAGRSQRNAKRSPYICELTPLLGFDEEEF
jgi:hypothetical protein